MLRGLWTFVVFLLITPGLALAALAVSLFHPRSDFVMRVGRLWSRALLAAVGARVEYSGVPPERWPQPCIFLSNHQSNVDIWALIAVLPHSTRFVAKQVLFRIPAMGWAMSAAGFVPIDRANRARAIRSLELAAAQVRAGMSVVLFPEGTRSRTGELQPFKKGPFHLAVRAGVPVLPLAISGSWRVMPPRGMRVHPGPVHVRALPPIDPGSFEADDHEGLRLRTRQVIEEALRELGDVRSAQAAAP
jgi:1-acyl-sn-glycerol-3-phosphate acyltransferase